MNNILDNHYMGLALEMAAKAAHLQEVPIGAVVVQNGKVIGQGWNQPISQHDPCAHAEIIALRQAALTVGNYRLPDASIYVTVEPCMMCAGALVHARIKRLIYGVAEPKAGAVSSRIQLAAQSWLNHQPEITAGVMEEECKEIISRFFADLRQAKKQHKSK